MKLYHRHILYLLWLVLSSQICHAFNKSKRFTPLQQQKLELKQLYHGQLRRPNTNKRQCANMLLVSGAAMVISPKHSLVSKILMYALFYQFYKNFNEKRKFKTSRLSYAFNPLQNTLEKYDLNNPPMNNYTALDPLKCVVTKVRNLSEAEGGSPFQRRRLKTIQKLNNTNDIIEVTLKHNKKFNFVEGQSVGIVIDNGSMELYSITSTRYGNDLRGKSLSFCVEKETSIVSSLKSGDKVEICGALGEESFLLQEDEKSRDFVFVSSHRSIPFIRPFLRRLFVENTKFGWYYSGNVKLVTEEKLRKYAPYRDEVDLIEQGNSERFSILDSRLTAEESKRLFEELENNMLTCIYFVGSDKVSDRVMTSLQRECSSRGLNYQEWKDKLVSNGQWYRK